jgi:hypothetical protein
MRSGMPYKIKYKQELCFFANIAKCAQNEVDKPHEPASNSQIA